MPTGKTERLVTISDVIFTAAVVAVAIAVWLALFANPGGSVAEIRLDGEIVAELPLDVDAAYTVEGRYTNVFEVRDGEIRVAHTTCPGRQCQKTGAVSAAGASIVCAPNRASATITGKGEFVDAITG